MATQTEIGPPSGGGPRKLETHGRIDLEADGDVAYWLKVFDTTRGELMAAVAKVGDDASRVAEYLKRGSDAEPPGTSQRPDGG